MTRKQWFIVRDIIVFMLAIIALCAALASCYNMAVSTQYTPKCPEGMFYSYNERACMPGVRP